MDTNVLAFKGSYITGVVIQMNGSMGIQRGRRCH